MRRFRNPQERPYFRRPGFEDLSHTSRWAERQGASGPGWHEQERPLATPNFQHPHRRHFRMPNPYFNNRTGISRFRPGFRGEPYGVYHTDAPNFYQEFA